MELLLFFSLIISAIICLIFLPAWIKKTKKIRLVWRDMNKYNPLKKISASGGIIVLMAFIIGCLYYIAFRTFLMRAIDGTTIKIFSIICIILILSIIALIDDLFGWKQGGLSISLRLFLILIASIPLIVINIGNSLIVFPFIGAINLGIFYSLIIVPLGIVGASATYNFLAGFNGLEAGQGILILSFLSFVAYKTGSAWLALIGLIMVSGLVIFYIYNKYPAKVFPGDILTYPIGALIACMAILGNFEKIALIIFIPYIIETILKIRGKVTEFKNKKEWPQSFGIPKKDKSLEMPYKKIYSLTHFSIFILKKLRLKNKVYEKDVVYFIFIIQIIFILWGLFII